MARSAAKDFRHATVIAVDFLAAKERGTTLKKLLETKTEIEKLKIYRNMQCYYYFSQFLLFS